MSADEDSVSMTFIRSFVPSVFEKTEAFFKNIRELINSKRILYKIAPYSVKITQRECGVCENNAKTVKTQVEN